MQTESFHFALLRCVASFMIIQSGSKHNSYIIFPVLCLTAKRTLYGALFDFLVMFLILLWFPRHDSLKCLSSNMYYMVTKYVSRIQFCCGVLYHVAIMVWRERKPQLLSIAALVSWVTIIPMLEDSNCFWKSSQNHTNKSNRLSADVNSISTNQYPAFHLLPCQQSRISTNQWVECHSLLLSAKLANQ